MPAKRPAAMAALRAGALMMTASLIWGSPAWAKRTPAELTATFEDRGSHAPRAAKVVPACTIHFAQILDKRSSSKLVGVIGVRAVLAPTDAAAWLRAVLGGLAVRGIQPAFDEAAAEPRLPTADFSLQTAWIDSSATTYSANVVVHLQAHNAAGQSLDQVYRGRVSRTAYWSGGVDTLQSAMNGAFADALDAMALDLKRLCPA